MPPDSTSVPVSSYEKLKEDVFSFKMKGWVVLLGNFNASVGSKAVDVDDVIHVWGGLPMPVETD